MEKYRKLEVGEKVVAGDYYWYRGFTPEDGMLPVSTKGRIHIGYTIDGTEACFAYRKTTETKHNMKKVIQNQETVELFRVDRINHYHAALIGEEKADIYADHEGTFRLLSRNKAPGRAGTLSGDSFEDLYKKITLLGGSVYEFSTYQELFKWLAE